VQHTTTVCGAAGQGRRRRAPAGARARRFAMLRRCELHATESPPPALSRAAEEVQKALAGALLAGLLLALSLLLSALESLSPRRQVTAVLLRVRLLLAVSRQLRGRPPRAAQRHGPQGLLSILV